MARDEFGGGVGVGVLELEDDAGVDVRGDAERGVAKGLLDFLQVGAAMSQVGGSAVP